MIRYVMALVVMIFGMTASQASAGNDVVVSPEEPVDGMSQADWSREWWQWAASFAVSESPVADPSGALCSSKQAGSVWFLAGTYGSNRTIRTCRIPQGKFIFFPLINYVVMPTTDPPTTCKNVTDRARRMTDNPVTLVLEVDGERVHGLVAYRQPTPACFDLGVRSDSGARIYPSAANGYYVMLRPLSPGKHTLNFGGILPDMAQAVTYTLEVE